MPLPIEPVQPRKFCLFIDFLFWTPLLSLGFLPTAGGRNWWSKGCNRKTGATVGRGVFLGKFLAGRAPPLVFGIGIDWFFLPS